MTITSETARISYAGAGTTGPLTVNWRFLADEDLTVIKTDAAGVSTTLILNTDYTVSGEGDASGGTVTTTAAVAAGETLVIFDDPDVLQETAYPANSPFPAATHEAALDRLTRIALRQKNLIDRAFVLPDSDASSASTVLPSPAAGKIIGWNNDASALQNYAAEDIATTIVGAGYNLDTFSGTGAQTAFTLTSAPGTENNTQVFVGGSYQPKSTYTVSGTTLTFASAPASGTNNIEVIYATAQITNITSVDADAVNTLAIQNSAVTYSKIQNISVTQRLLGRNSAGAGIAQEVTVSQLLDWVSGTNGKILYRTGGVWGVIDFKDEDNMASDSATAVPSQQSVKTYVDTLGIPQNSKSAAYTTVLSDANKHLLHPSADTTARTFTIDANATVPYPIGTAITFVNQASAGVLTIAITTDTMRLAGAGTTGSRTLAANGIATALKLTTTEWIISGAGLS